MSDPIDDLAAKFAAWRSKATDARPLVEAQLAESEALLAELATLPGRDSEEGKALVAELEAITAELRAYLAFFDDRDIY